LPYVVLCRPTDGRSSPKWRRGQARSCLSSEHRLLCHTMCCFISIGERTLLSFTKFAHLHCLSTIRSIGVRGTAIGFQRTIRRIDERKTVAQCLPGAGVGINALQKLAIFIGSKRRASLLDRRKATEVILCCRSRWKCAWGRRTAVNVGCPVGQSTRTILRLIRQTRRDPTIDFLAVWGGSTHPYPALKVTRSGT
jgi:hypothetical protein